MSDDDRVWDAVTSQAQYKAGIAIAKTRQLWKGVRFSHKGFPQKGDRLLLLIQKVTEMYREIITLTEVIVGRGKHPQFDKIRTELQEALLSLIQAMKTLDDVLESRNLDERREITREILVTLDVVQQQMQDLEKRCRKWANCDHYLPTLFTSLRNLAKQVDSTINLLLDRKSQKQVSLQSVPFNSPT
ncbi:MAG: hypothetical protein WBV73_01285, partial [Phormidium sp.]